MVLLPAIDLLDNKCVRLKMGVYSSSEKVAEDAIDTAKNFIASGASFIHIVDLNGAKTGIPKNDNIIKELAKLPVRIQTGGGIRTLERATELIECGVDRVIFGTVAVENIQLIKEAVQEFGDKIAVSIDALGGKVKTSGWLDNSNLDYLEFAKQIEDVGVKTIVFTDIAKDGMLSGANFSQLEMLKYTVDCDIIASGGISSMQDLCKIYEMKLYGAILGKSIYAKKIELKTAVEKFERQI